MSLAIEFTNPSKVCEFLEWMAQGQAVYEWQDDVDRVYVETTSTPVPGKVQRSYRIVIWLPKADMDSPTLMRVVGHLGATPTEEVPADILQSLDARDLQR